MGAPNLSPCQAPFSLLLPFILVPTLRFRYQGKAVGVHTSYNQLSHQGVWELWGPNRGAGTRGEPGKGRGGSEDKDLVTLGQHCLGESC